MKREFKKSINQHWSQKIANIPENDPSKTLPEINKIFRKKDKPSLPNTIIIPENKSIVLTHANINPLSANKDQNGNFAFTEQIEKLNILDSHFSLIHTQNEHMGKEVLTMLIISETEKLEAEMEQDRERNNSIVNFTMNNDTLCPSAWLGVFSLTSIREVKEIFRRLNNKR